MKTTSPQKKVHRGQYLEGIPIPALSIATRVGAESWSTGISTGLDTHGREAALSAPTLIRVDRTQRGKCCVSSSSIRSPSSEARVSPFMAPGGHGPLRTMSVLGYSRLIPLGG